MDAVPALDEPLKKVLGPATAKVMAEHLGLRGGVLYHGMAREEDPSGVYSSTWVILTRDPGLFDSPALSGDVEPLEVEPDVRTWTDDDANLFKVLK